MMKQKILLFIAMLISSTTLWAQATIEGVSGDGSQASPYLISSSDVWNTLSAKNQAGETFNGMFLKMTADITADKYFDKTFSGHFDGDGHTITANIKSGDDFAALFRFVNGATIRNLNLAGSMEVGMHGAALAGRCDGNLTLEDIVVSANIKSMKEYSGGVVGHAMDATLKINGVVFSGKMTFGQDVKGILSGGIIGWGLNYAATLTDVLFCGTFESDTPFTPIAGKEHSWTWAVQHNALYTQEGKDVDYRNYSAKGLRAYICDQGDIYDELTKDYGLVQAYELGIKLGDKYYRSTRLSGNGTQDKPFLIRNADEWNHTVEVTANGNSFQNQYLKVAADFTTDTKLNAAFNGHFDGDGHTITANIKSAADNTALFCVVNGATIRNLRVAGSMQVGRYGAALVGLCDGNLTLENIVVSTSLSYKIDDSGFGGGIIGNADNETLKLDGVVFDGKITVRQDQNGELKGGIIGWGENYTATLTDVLFCGTFEGETPFTPIAGKWSGRKKPTLVNTLYTQESKNANDEDIAARGWKTNISDQADNCGKLTKDYGLLQAYEHGFKFGDKYYISTGMYGRGTQDSPFIISSADDWKLAVEENDHGYTYQDQNLKVTSDFETDLSFNKTFSGHFDGDGHTITANIMSRKTYGALFQVVNGATIRNLKVAGRIEVGLHGAALAAQCEGNLTLENIVVSASVYGEKDYAGGVVGHAMNSTLILSGVVFSGGLACNEIAGGIIGWGDNYTATLTDVLFCGIYNSSSKFYPIALKAHDKVSKTSLINILYTEKGEMIGNANIAVKGVKANISDQADNCGKLTKDYGLLQAYDHGFKFGDKYYISTGMYGRGTQDSPFLISSADDWKNAAEINGQGDTFQNKYLKVTADFTTDLRFEKTFSGHLDGDSHTITANIKSGDDFAALFRFVNGAIIRNLNLAGSMEVGKHGAALVGICDGDLTLEAIAVSANVLGKGDYTGGIVGNAMDATLKLTGVGFCGIVNGNTVGGIIGWGENYTATLTDVIYRGTSVGREFAPIAVKWENKTAKVTTANVLTTEGERNMKDERIAGRGTLVLATEKSDKLGILKADYGMVKIYENGASIGDKQCRTYQLQGQGTQTAPFLIRDNDDWRIAAHFNSNGNDYRDKYLKVTTDFTTDEIFVKNFKGTFDGDSHTITASITSNDENAALFKYVDGAEIRNLKMAGKMSVGTNGAALVGQCNGDLRLENIVVSTDITFVASPNHGLYGGGIVGNALSTRVDMEGVVFDGTLQAPYKNAGFIVAGIIGWGENYTAYLKDIVFCGRCKGINAFIPIAAKGRYYTVCTNFDNVFYTQEGRTVNSGFALNDYFAIRGTAAFIDDNAESVGSLKKDYGMVQSYLYGVGYGGKYYHSTTVEGDGSEENPLIIANDANWMAVAETINSGTTYAGKYLKLTADINVDNTVKGIFSGHLNGGGHTITSSISNKDDFAALFMKVSGATISHLKLAGSMFVSHHGAALVGRCEGDLTLEDVVVTTTLIFQRGYPSDGMYNGGIIGHALDATLKFSGVVFSGTIEKADELLVGGIIGWGDNYKATLTDVFFCGTYEGKAPFTPIAAKWDKGSASVTAHNVLSLSDNSNVGGGNIALNAIKPFNTDNTESCGKMTKDYGLLKAYERGILYEGKLYRSAELLQAGTQDAPYLVYSVEDWEHIVGRGEAGGYPGKYFLLKNDFTTDRLWNDFRGNLNGNGHTITANITERNEGGALFSHVNGATIRNLRVAGDMQVGRHGAALVGMCDGDLTLENIVVSTNLNYKFDGNAYGGGVIGHAVNATLKLDGVVFDGKITVEQNLYEMLMGGIIGWGDNYKATLTDVLFCGTYEGEAPFTPIAGKWNGGNTKLTAYNALYIEVSKNAGDAYVAAKAFKADISEQADGCGELVKNYGMLEGYVNGFKFGDKYYSSTGLYGRGTHEHPYLIRNFDDWKQAAEFNKDGWTYDQQYLKQTADFTTDLSFDKTFSGSFDGDSHTITSTINDPNSYYTALFRNVSGATICNLKLAGATEVGRHGAALVGICNGDLTLQNVVVSTDVTIANDAYAGGIIGDASNAKLDLSGVAYSGNIVVQPTNETTIGGIIGWSGNCTFNMKDVFFCGTVAHHDYDHFYSIAARWEKGSANVTASNVISVNPDENVASDNIAYRGLPGFQTDIEESCGAQTKDYGLLLAYQRGFLYEGKLYRSAELLQAGTQDAPYLVYSVEDWEHIVGRGEAGGYPGKYFLLKNDFTTDRLWYDFRGNLNGNGHTITANITERNEGGALFSHVIGATIRNLRVAGDMQVGRHGAALVGMCDGDLTLENIVVSTNLNYKFDGNAYGGGVIGHAVNATLKLDGVVFDGKMTGEPGNKRLLMGGIIGWGDNYKATLTDVLFCGTYEGEAPFTPIAGKWNSGNPKLTAYNALYIQEGKNAGDAYVAAKAFKADISEQADGCGELVKNYGMLEGYVNGFKFGDKYYSSTGLYGRGTHEHPYLIRNFDDWKRAAEFNKDGWTYDQQYLKQTADFTTDLSFDKTFSGSFDGDSHTITSTINDPNSDYTALFRNVSGATICNLKLAGATEVSKHGAALVGYCDGDLTMKNIVVSTDISYKFDGNAYGGSIIGHAMNATLKLGGVVFNGKMTSEPDKLGGLMGGIIGWGENYTADMRDILFCGTYEGETPFTPIAGKYDRATVNITSSNVYYTQEGKNTGDEFIAVKGERAIATEKAENMGSLIEDYGLLKGYENGLFFDGYYYYGAMQSYYSGIENSVIGNEDNSGWYDLSGRKLQGKPTQKGLYIFNGRQTVVK